MFRESVPLVDSHISCWLTLQSSSQQAKIKNGEHPDYISGFMLHVNSLLYISTDSIFASHMQLACQWTLALCQTIPYMHFLWAGSKPLCRWGEVRSMWQSMLCGCIKVQEIHLLVDGCGLVSHDNLWKLSIQSCSSVSGHFYVATKILYNMLCFDQLKSLEVAADPTHKVSMQTVLDTQTGDKTFLTIYTRQRWVTKYQVVRTCFDVKFFLNVNHTSLHTAEADCDTDTASPNIGSQNSEEWPKDINMYSELLGTSHCYDPTSTTSQSIP